MCWSSSSTNRGIDQRAEDEPRLDDLGDPPVDDGAGVDDDVRLAGDAAGAFGRRAPDEPDGLGRDQQVPALGDGQAEHPETQEQRHARAAATFPTARRSRASGRPSSRPISRPISSPMTAVTNSAVESSSTRADQPGRRDDGDVRQDREAHARPRPRPRRPGARRRSRSPRTGRRRPSRGRGRRAPKGGAKDTDIADQRLPRPFGRRSPDRGSARTGRQPSIAGTASLRPAPSAQAPARWLRGASRATSIRTPGISGVGRSRPAAGRWPGEAEPSRLAQAALEAGHAAQLTEQAHLADRRPCRGRPAGRAATRPGPARAAGPGRARSRDRPPARFA